MGPLDLPTERRVLDSALASLRKTTIIAITHRTSVAERMDRIGAIARSD